MWHAHLGTSLGDTLAANQQKPQEIFLQEMPKSIVTMLFTNKLQYKHELFYVRYLFQFHTLHNKTTRSSLSQDEFPQATEEACSLCYEMR